MWNTNGATMLAQRYCHIWRSIVRNYRYFQFSSVQTAHRELFYSTDIRPSLVSCLKTWIPFDALHHCCSCKLLEKDRWSFIVNIIQIKDLGQFFVIRYFQVHFAFKVFRSNVVMIHSPLLYLFIGNHLLLKGGGGLLGGGRGLLIIKCTWWTDVRCVIIQLYVVALNKSKNINKKGIYLILFWHYKIMFAHTIPRKRLSFADKRTVHN